MSQTPAQFRSLVPQARGVAVGPAQVSAPRSRSSFIIHRSSFLRAYTLIEVLIVAVIVVLMVGMALPVFRAITGSRSEAGASNIIAGMLGRARTDAIGLDKTMGIAFLYNPSTQLSYMAEVEFPDAPAFTLGMQIAPSGYASSTFDSTNFYFVNNGSTTVTIHQVPATTRIPSPPAGMAAVGGPPLDIRANTDLVPLPAGIGVQTICNSSFSNSGVRTTDGYLSVGVILFDGNGRLVGQNYGVSASSRLMATPGLTPADYPVPNQNIGSPYVASTWPRFFGVQSQFGLVVFQQEAFVAQNFPTLDHAYDTANPQQMSAYTNGSPSQKTEEDWLDANATPLLIDRYTGTLIKAE